MKNDDLFSFGNNDNNSSDGMEDLSSNAKSDVFDLNSFANMDVEPDEIEKYSVKSKNVKGKKSKADLPLKNKILKIALATFLICTITLSLIIGVFMVYVFGFVDATMDEDLNNLTLDLTTTIYVKDTKTGEYEEYQRLHGMYNRIWVNYNRELATANDENYDGIPQNLADAFIAIEDKRFNDHNGVDWKRTFSAFANFFLHFWESEQGGSSITQQLVKNLTGDEDRSPMRKVREIMRSRYLEEKYSKDVILECYMNTVGMARGMYGVEVASNYYFDKNVSELDLAECATLAAIVKGPSIYRPDTKYENNTQRRLLVLKAMYDQKYITAEEYNAAKAQEVKIVANTDTMNEQKINSYFVDALIEEVTKDLSDKYDYDPSHASINFYNGGYKIYCTLDPSVQKALESVFTDNEFVDTKSKKGQKLQASMTVMDYKGNIVGMIGGMGEKTENRALNRATMSPRQAGSTIKPISAYAPALEKNLITYSSFVNDKRLTYKSAEGPWNVNNWYGGYWGNVTVKRALENSINTIPVQLVEKVGLKTSYDFLTQKLGFKSFDPVNDLNLPSLGMGGNYHGITTMESAAAFAIFGNGGSYYEPTTYEKVVSADGEVLLEKNTKPTIAISQDTSFIMNKLLQNVVYGPEGTASAVASSVNNMKIFAKTGTSDSTQNQWLVGGSPYYVASCWIGYDEYETVSNATIGKKLWGRVMGKINNSKTPKDFPSSSYVTCREYCTETGMVATEACTSKAIGWYKTSYMPVCNVHSGEVLGEYDPNATQKPSDTTQDTQESNDGDQQEAQTESVQENTQTSDVASQ